MLKTESNLFVSRFMDLKSKEKCKNRPKLLFKYYYDERENVTVFKKNNMVIPLIHNISIKDTDLSLGTKTDVKKETTDYSPIQLLVDAGTKTAKKESADYDPQLILDAGTKTFVKKESADYDSIQLLDAGTMTKSKGESADYADYLFKDEYSKK